VRASDGEIVAAVIDAAALQEADHQVGAIPERSNVHALSVVALRLVTSAK
jgi:hypothetical protein